MIKIALIIATFFLCISLLAVGGGKAIIPELHHEAVGVRHWMTDKQFVEVYAIAQAAPGPGRLIVSLIGYKAGLEYGIWFGLICALLATAAMFTPPFLLCYGASRAFKRYQEMPWHDVAQKAASSVTLGLLFATALIVARGSDHGVAGWILTAITACLVAFTKVNPLILMAAGAVLGLLGWI